MPANSPSSDIRIDEVLTAIVKRFIELIGAPTALSAARKIDGLRVADDGTVLDYDHANPIDNVTQLLEQYRVAFGDTAVALAHRAAQPIVKEQAASLLIEAGFEPPPGSFVVRLLLVDDHVLFREGLVSLIAPQPDFQIVEQAGTVQEAIALTQRLRPDIVLMDFTLPDGTGLEATQTILATLPDTKIVFLTVHDDDDTLFNAIRAGAVGFLFKNTRSSELLKRLRAVARGEAGISPAIARRVLEEFSRTPAHLTLSDVAQSTELTAREVEIVREIARGASNREIAQRLVISENTVKNHVRNVLAKLHLRNRREVGDYARRHGLTPPSSAKQ
jgi:two-component system NarL family response regulator